MAGYSGGQHDMQDGGLDQLFSQLRHANASQSQQRYPSGLLQNFQPSVSSPLPTPPIHNQPPHDASAIMSPASEFPPQPRQSQSHGASNQANTAHTNSLLNLLKFSAPVANTTSQPAPISLQHHPSQQSNGGASDLLATLMGASSKKENEDLSARLRAAAEKEARDEEAAKAPPADTQQYLLQLLNRPKPAQTERITSPITKTTDITANFATPTRESQPASRVVDYSPDQHTRHAANVSDASAAARSASEARSATSDAPAFSTTGSLSKATGQSQISQGLFTYVNPFDQLAASSPRNRTPKPSVPAVNAAAPTMQILKRRVGERSPSASPAPLQKVKHNEAPTAETVASAMSELGSQVNKEVEEAISRAELKNNTSVDIEKDLRHMLDARSKSEFEANAQLAASAIKQELEKAGNEDVLEDALPAPVAEVVKEIVDEVSQGHMPDSWENEDLISTKGENAVKVYNFPMKPWISIALTLKEHQICVFNDTEVFDVARLKKEFDQIDRTLVTASSGFVVYGMPKNGGIRAIRQDDGKDMKIFDDTKDRVFNVSISTAKDSAAEAAIGTGVSGTVYWVDLRAAEGDFIQDRGTVANNQGFALPAIHSPGEETSGGMLKTRARKSSSHPEFFAVGRGKSIHMIWPAVITKQKYLKPGKERVVDTDKYLQHQSLKINTGKAGKDFSFSQDDTTIVSLDKAGKVKFWDVQTLTNTSRGTDARIPTPEQIQPVEIREPIMSFSTTRENTKAWPTSVQFIDKERPYKKGGPLRYLLVGMKQNHTLQLWDLVLRRAVQEIKLPHEKESDAVCSIAYHPASGILAVGHPTRNSIFFIHVSAPRYEAPKNNTQAEFMQKLANKDPSISQPKATAVMSGMREYSFASKGQLRSLDMLQSPTTASNDPENPVLFELYVMHSKGVTYVAVKREDMGWTKDHKDAIALDAIAEGLITVEPLKEVPNYETTVEASSPKHEPMRIIPREVSPEKPGPATITPVEQPAMTRADSPVKAAKIDRSLSPTKANKADSTSSPAVESNIPVPDKSSGTIGVEKVEKKKKKKTASTAVAKEVSSSAIGTSNGVEAVEPATTPKSSSGFALSDDIIGTVIQRVESGVSAELAKTLSTSFDSLHKNIKDDRRAQAAQHAANQEALIRLVATTLDENVGRSLEGIIGESMTRSVVPAINQNMTVSVVPAITQATTTAITKAVTEQLNIHLSAHLGSQLNQALGKELRNVLPEAVAKSLQKPATLKLMSESLANSLAFKVEEQFTSLLTTSIVPAFTDLASQAVQQATADIRRQASEHIDIQSREYNTKIDKLTQVVTSLTETISSMADAQAKQQDQFMKFQQVQQQQQNVAQESSTRDPAPRVPSRSFDQTQAHAHHPSNPQHNPSQIAQQPQPQTVARIIAPVRVEQESPVDGALIDISQAMAEANFEDACMLWLQFNQEAQQEMFVKYFSQIDPAFVRELTSLMLLSLSSVVTIGIEGPTLLERLSYIEAILREYQQRVDVDLSITEVVPKIMSIIVQRVEHLLIRISHVSPQDIMLRRLANIINMSKRISAASQDHVPQNRMW